MSKITIAEEIKVSLLWGQVTFCNSCLTCLTNWAGDVFFFSIFIYSQTNFYYWQEWQDLNPQPPVLETGALPVELHSYFKIIAKTNRTVSNTYSIISATTPAPTVLPPSLIANFRPLSIAIGDKRVTSIVMLSPGITISVPSGSLIVPVTSVVLK